METRAMDQNSAEGVSGEAMTIFAQSIDVRRPGRSRRRATQKVLSPEIGQQATPSTERRHQRRAVVESERARAEFELSRATTMAKELERQIEETSAKASSFHRSGLHGTRATGGGRRKKGHVDVEAPGGDRTLQSDALYVEVMHELERVKRELRKLHHEVRSARESMAKAERDVVDTPTPWVLRSESRVPESGAKSEAGKVNEERVIAEVAEAGGLGKGVLMKQAATRMRVKGVVCSDTSRASDTEGSFATASSTDVENEAYSLSLTIKRHGDVGDHDDASLQTAAEAELNSARIELVSIKEEAIQFVDITERTREEKARLAEEIGRLKDQEKKARAQVHQLNAKLLRTRSRLEAVTADDEKAEAALAELSLALRKLGEETEAAEKEKSLTELETQCVREDAENVDAEIAAAERRVRQSVKELEAARAAEAASTAKLKAALDSATMTSSAAVTSPTSGNVTITRFEYEYLTARAEVVRATAEKKVAAAEAWVEALRAGEKELTLRVEAIEREIGEATAGEAEDTSCQSAPGMEPRRRAAAARESEALTTSGRTRTPLSALARKRMPPSPNIDKQRNERVGSCLQVIAQKCGHG